MSTTTDFSAAKTILTAKPSTSEGYGIFFLCVSLYRELFLLVNIPGFFQIYRLSFLCHPQNQLEVFENLVWGVLKAAHERMYAFLLKSSAESRKEAMIRLGWGKLCGEVYKSLCISYLQSFLRKNSMSSVCHWKKWYPENLTSCLDWVFQITSAQFIHVSRQC